MKTNVGSIDRTLRVIIGIGLLGLLFVLEGSARWFGLIGIIPLGTASIGYCPLYSILGISSWRAGGRETHA
jgi:Inner membrane protein YgaP-like, transmembrane domain